MGEGERLRVYGDQCARDGECGRDFCTWVILLSILYGLGRTGTPIVSRHIQPAPRDADLCSHCTPGCSCPPSPCLGCRSHPRLGPLGQLYLPHSASQPAGGESRQRGVRATPGANDQTRRVLGAVQVLVIGSCWRMHVFLSRALVGDLHHLEVSERAGLGRDGKGWQGIGSNEGRKR